ncbi:MAG: KH domain-containing protein [Candidatus Obscuribacter sp.]|nr:KH domain-containing protein [Candidatus Obscuribacter sp.]MBK9277833.1 KH domain-containing protein [Candidatus Obscuribacter sp.]HND04097.1 R3H domain-containing nucleic acid-binding protein [Candidatus Obscuribacter sp.]
MNLSQFDDNARSYLEKILAILDIEAEVVQEDVDDTTTCYRIDCKSDDARILIGKNGATLESLQFVVRQMVKSQTLDRSHFIVDVCDYRGRRRRTLEDQAKRGAVAVLNGDSERFPLVPMSAYDRRLVHNYLQENFPELASESEGDGEGRHIVISFKGLPNGGNGAHHDGGDEDDDYVPAEEDEAEEGES